MENKRIVVSVAGQNFAIVSELDEQYIKDIAENVDNHINSMVESSSMSREKCAIMTALDFADDEAREKKNLQEIREQIKDYIEEIDSIKAENGSLKEKLEEAETVRNENNEIKK